MTTNIQDTPNQADRRRAMMHIIARYPAIAEEELASVLTYFRREASALDRGTIASEERIYSQYRQLCDDHRIDRLRLGEAIITIVFALALIAGILAMALS